MARLIVFVVVMLSGSLAWSQENSIFNGGVSTSAAYACFAEPSSNSIFVGGNESSSQLACYEELVQVISGKVFLGGPYDTINGLMKDDLRSQGLLPLEEPYANLGMYNGTDQVASSAVFATVGQTAIVDWILVEFRDLNDASIVTRQVVGLVQSNGSIVDMDGASPLKLRATEDSVLIAIRHRNHLGALLKAPLSLNGSDTVFFDFTDAAELKEGDDAIQNIGGVDVLWAGNAVLPGLGVSYTGSNNDRDAILVAVGGGNPTNVIVDYDESDINMDGQIKYTGSANDRDIILVNIGGGVPTAIRIEQLP